MIDRLLDLFWFSHRYPVDAYDRYWFTCMGENWKQLNASIPDDSFNKSDLYQPGSIIMSTAVASGDDSTPLLISWYSEHETDQFYVYMHFTEIQVLPTNQTRQFNITRNGELRVPNFSPRYLAVDTLYTSSAISGKQIKYSLERTENSTLPPIVSAIELYRVIDLQKPQTFQGDGIFHFLNPFTWLTLFYMNLTTFYPSFCIENKLKLLQASSQFME